MRSLGKYIVKIFALVEGSNKNSAILFSNKTYSKLATSYPIGIREAFQFFNGRDFFQMLCLDYTFNSGCYLFSRSGVVEFIKLPFKFLTKNYIHDKPIFFITWLVLASPLLRPARTSLASSLSSTSSTTLTASYFSASNFSMANMLLPSLVFSLIVTEYVIGSRYNNKGNDCKHHFPNASGNTFSNPTASKCYEKCRPDCGAGERQNC